MTFDFNTQLILSQINNLYSTEGVFGMYDLVFDFLIKQGHSITVAAEEKTRLWEEAKNKVLTKHKRLVEFKGYPVNQLKELRLKYYKSSLCAKYLMDIYNTTSQRLDIKDDGDNKIKLITFTAR